MVELAYNYNPKRDYQIANWWASPKYDGVRGIFDVANNGLFTRQGKRIPGGRTIEESCRAYAESFKESGINIETVEGELWIPDTDFSTISGIVRKCECDDKAGLILRVFAVKSTMPTHQMIANLPEKDEYPLLESVEYQSIPNTPASVLEFATNNTYSEEGIMLRHETISYTDGRSHNLLKVKKMYTSEFTITSINKGTGKYYGSLGSLSVTNMIDDVTVTSKIGTGFTDDERQAIWNNQSDYLGKDVEILYMGVTSGGSLRQPVFVRIIQ